MTDSLFTKIINHDIPSYKIYEDDFVYSFLDIHPLTKGHVLVVPKSQVEFVWDLDETDYSRLMAATKKIARHLRTVLSVAYVEQRIVGVDVPHAHVHLIPFDMISQLDNTLSHADEPDHAALATLATALAF